MRIDEIYPTNNARHLKPSEVAKSFIYSESFGKLIQNNNTVILGARGCGKTTLMKMLTLPALYAWEDDRAEGIINSIEFYGIYISTDIYWDVKNQTYSSQLEKFGGFSDVISAFSVNSNVFTSLCDTFQYVIDLDLKIHDEGKEIELCSYLIKAWKLDAVIPKLTFIKEAINQRIDQVNQAIQNLIFNQDKNANIPHFDFFNLSFESSLESIIPVFERIYSIVGKKRWALSFDELEFAPLWLQEKLFKSLRSRAQYILYKLSASPILSSELDKLLQGDYRATAGNDMQMIKMWTSTDNEKFSRKIIDSLLLKKFNIADADSFFGSNEIYNKHTGSYTKGSTFYKQLVELSKKDDSFNKFLKYKKIDIMQPSFNDKEQKDTIFRKIKPVVYFRNFYIDKNLILERGLFDTKRRGRKTSELFYGIEVLTKICDGNPRWLIGIITAILSKSSPNGADKKVQYDELLSSSKRFKNVIANIPIGKDQEVSLIKIIDKIGYFFKDQLLGRNFNMDPKGTFVVDQSKIDVSDNVTFLLEKAVSQGALILLESNDDSFDFEIRGQRFKLSFLFSLLYNLPLRNYPPAKLSECLRGIESDNQKSLFD